jgi:hypothetical protein
VKSGRKIVFPKGKVVDVVGPGTKSNYLKVKYRNSKIIEVPSKNLEFLYE